jgi:hypothetical protein
MALPRRLRLNQKPKSQASPDQHIYGKVAFITLDPLTVLVEHLRTRRVKLHVLTSSSPGLIVRASTVIAHPAC